MRACAAVCVATIQPAAPTASTTAASLAFIGASRPQGRDDGMRVQPMTEIVRMIEPVARQIVGRLALADLRPEARHVHERDTVAPEGAQPLLVARKPCWVHPSALVRGQQRRDHPEL